MTITGTDPVGSQNYFFSETPGVGMTGNYSLPACYRQGSIMNKIGVVTTCQDGDPECLAIKDINDNLKKAYSQNNYGSPELTVEKYTS